MAEKLPWIACAAKLSPPTEKMPKTIKVSDIRHGNPGRTGWNAILPDPAPPNVLDEHFKADWLVIGGGFAGLAAACRLSQLRPDDKTVLLESIRIGDNAAGRSSGFMIDLPHDISSDSYTGNYESDKQQTIMNRTAVKFARQAAEEYDFSQETFDPRGKIYSSATPSGDKHNRDYEKYLDGLGEPYEALDAKDLAQISGTNYYTSGLFTPGGAMIQPALFVRSLAQGLQETGAADIYENSAVLELQKEGSAWKASTAKGSVTAPKVILAVNGHIQSFGFFKRRLMHIFLYASMTRVLTNVEVNTLGGEPTWDFVPADPVGSTVRRISGIGGNRILVRNRFHYSLSIAAEERDVAWAAKDHDASFLARFPMLKDVEMEYRWGGRLCLSWHGVPAFGEVEDGIFSACCQNGLGASKGLLAGILAAEQATGTDSRYVDEYLAMDQPTRLPPEPLSTIGATVYLNWKERQAGREK